MIYVTLRVATGKNGMYFTMKEFLFFNFMYVR